MIRDGDPLRSKILSILLMALFLITLYLFREGVFTFYKPSISLTNRVYQSVTLPAPQTYIQIDGGHDKGIYKFPKQEGISLLEVIKRTENDVVPLNISGDTIIKNGSKVTIRPDKSIEIGIMDGEKLILFGIPIDINMAQVNDLEAIPGIGKVLARRIIEKRDIIGGFSSVGDLKRVKGIGEKRLREIAHLVQAE